MSSRLSRPELFMSIAHLFGQRSSCPRADVGCIATLEGRIIASGYVGAPSGQPHCLEAGCLLDSEGHCIRTIHAETNLVTWAARKGTMLEGATVWTTHSPCFRCVLILSNAGIKDLHWHYIYDEDALELMFGLGVKGNRQPIPGVAVES
jgi:dCMP deaminase